MTEDEYSPDWRKDWEVDLAKRRASHRAGWVVEFDAKMDEDEGINGRCVARPEHLSVDEMLGAARILRQAGDVYGEVLFGAAGEEA